MVPPFPLACLALCAPSINSGTNPRPLKSPLGATVGHRHHKHLGEKITPERAYSIKKSVKLLSSHTLSLSVKSSVIEVRCTSARVRHVLSHPRTIWSRSHNMATTNATITASAPPFATDKVAMRVMQGQSMAGTGPDGSSMSLPGHPGAPAWGSYLYQNFLLPAFSPSEWMQATTPSGSLPPGASMPSSHGDYFAWTSQAPTAPPQQPKSEPPSTVGLPHHPPAHHHVPSPHPTHIAPGVQGYYGRSYYPPPSSIPTSLLQSNSTSISPVSVEVIDNQISHSGTPSPPSNSLYNIVSTSPPNVVSHKHGVKRRASSLESESHDEHEIAEGVERDGMIWGMKVEEYRALSARERKRVRNRISARTFRAKRKEHLSSLETDLETKDMQIKAARDEALRLRAEVAALKKRLSQYERQ